MSVLDRLTEGIVNRNLQKEGTALLNKWEKTGLLEGMDNESSKATMARLLENQAKELLREASSMAAGDVTGFAAVAFPIVRRVFGSLIANDLVSVQPMSLPSGLIFFMDFTHNTDRFDGGANTSLYGGGKVASQITGGVDIGPGVNAERGFYSLNNGYASPTGTADLAGMTVVTSGTVGSGLIHDVSGSVTAATIGNSTVATSVSKLVRYDPDLQGKSVVIATATGASLGNLNREDLLTLNMTNPGAEDGSSGRLVRRLTTLVGRSTAYALSNVPELPITDATNTSLLLVFEGTASAGSAADNAGLATNVTALTAAPTVTFAIKDNFTTTGADSIGGVMGADPWALEGASNSSGMFDGQSKDRIPEIDIKVDSVSVTAITKKLKAKWTPELGQDLQA